jgi:3-oxoacyl-[acyl-carrier-protein] synthase-1/3-oxoacyl-[acyl-carrier-protein] synthase II
VVRDVLEESGLSLDTLRVGLVVGTSSGNISGPFETWHRQHLDGKAGEAHGCSRATPTREIAKKLGFSGPIATLSVACASGTAAFALGLGWLQDDLADAVVLCGLDALSLYIHAGFAGLGALSSDTPRPFHPERDGLLLGEGAAALVVEPMEPARAGARFLAEVGGVGLSTDAVHLTAPDRTGNGAARSMRQAMATPAVEAQDIDTLSVHGTGTVFNDAMEAHALQQIFGSTPVASHGIKHAIGHTLGAAGAVEAAVVVEALLQGRRPPSPPVVAEDLPLPHPPPAHEPVRIALSTSSAFGGVNSAVVLSVPGVLPRHSSAPAEVVCLARIQREWGPGPLPWREEWPGSPDRIRRVNRYVRAGLLALHSLIETLEAPLPPGCGMVLASESNCMETDLRYHARLVELGAARASRLDFAATIPGAPLAEASILWNLQGPCIALVEPMEQAETEAARLLRWGRASMILALGLEAPGTDQPAVASVALLSTLQGARPPEPR